MATYIEMCGDNRRRNHQEYCNVLDNIPVYITPIEHAQAANLRAESTKPIFDITSDRVASSDLGHGERKLTLGKCDIVKKTIVKAKHSRGLRENPDETTVKLQRFCIAFGSVLFVSVVFFMGVVIHYRSLIITKEDDTDVKDKNIIATPEIATQCQANSLSLQNEGHINYVETRCENFEEVFDRTFKKTDSMSNAKFGLSYIFGKVAFTFYMNPQGNPETNVLLPLSNNTSQHLFRIKGIFYKFVQLFNLDVVAIGEGVKYFQAASKKWYIIADQQDSYYSDISSHGCRFTALDYRNGKLDTFALSEINNQTNQQWERIQEMQISTQSVDKESSFVYYKGHFLITFNNGMVYKYTEKGSLVDEGRLKSQASYLSCIDSSGKVLVIASSERHIYSLESETLKAKKSLKNFKRGNPKDSVIDRDGIVYISFEMQETGDKRLVQYTTLKI